MTITSPDDAIHHASRTVPSPVMTCGASMEERPGIQWTVVFARVTCRHCLAELEVAAGGERASP